MKALKGWFIIAFLIWPLVCKGSVSLSQESLDLVYLQKAKSFLLRGDLETSKKFLDKVEDKKSQIFIIKKRYESLKLFLEKQYDKSLSILEEQEFHRLLPFKEICLQKVITIIMSSKMKDFQKVFKLCSYLNHNVSKNEQFWMKVFVSVLENSSLGDLRTALSMRETASIGMKNALYFNKEQSILDNINYIPKEVLESPEIKELLGLIYFRLGHYIQALNFVQINTSPNAENIKGNIALQKQDYIKAYEHFKLAIEKRPDSLNALHRIIPISWILKKWDEGITFLSSLPINYGNPEKRGALESAFYIKLGQYDRADRSLRKIKNIFRNKMRKDRFLSLPKEVVFIQSYLSLINNNQRELLDSSHAACKNLDGLNCWFVLQQLLWENVSLNINRKDPVHKTTLDIEALKKRQDVIPLKEEIMIDQHHIEELDGLF